MSIYFIYIYIYIYIYIHIHMFQYIDRFIHKSINNPVYIE